MRSLKLMNKQKNNYSVSGFMQNDRIKLFFLIFALVFFICFGIKILNTKVFYVSKKDIYEYKQKIAIEEVTISQLKSNLKKMQSDLLRYNEERGDEEKKIFAVKQKIEKYRRFSGFTKVEGEGVIIVIDDALFEPEEDENILDFVVHDMDIRILINELYNAGAEAIAVNENRMVLGLSEVFCNGPTIRVNGVQQSKPYIIKAIGDKYKLSKALLDSESYGINLLKYGLQYELITKTCIEIEGYLGRGSLKYAKLMED